MLTFENIVNKIAHHCHRVEFRSHEGFDFLEVKEDRPPMFYVKRTDLSPHWINVVCTKEIAFAFSSGIIVYPENAVGRRYIQGAEINDEHWRELYNATKDVMQYTDHFSHYDFLDMTIEHFGPLVFGKPNGWHFDYGMIGAHGDKCYSYMADALEEHNIPKWHTAMLFLLTYTKEMDREKHLSYEWIIENYDRYKAKLEECYKLSGL